MFKPASTHKFGEDYSPLTRSAPPSNAGTCCPVGILPTVWDGLEPFETTKPDTMSRPPLVQEPKLETAIKSAWTFAYGAPWLTT